jgi:hypothetical protein
MRPWNDAMAATQCVNLRSLAGILRSHGQKDCTVARPIVCSPGYLRPGARTLSANQFMAALFATLLMTTVASWTPLSYAIGPTLPIRFVDLPEFRDPWAVQLQVDPQRIRVLRIQRLAYVDGELVETEQIDTKYEPQANRESVELTAHLPLRFKAMEELKQRRTFTEQIIVEGQWTKQDTGKPLVIQRWFYFLVRGGKLERVDMETYSNFTDRAEMSIDSRGKLTLVHAGRDLKGPVPLSETKKSFAVSLGRLGGAVQEDVPSDQRRKKEEDDRKEKEQY